MAGSVVVTGVDATSSQEIPMNIYAVANRMQVAAPSETPAIPTVSLFRDLTTTRQSIALPSGALWVAISYRLLPGATAVTNQFARVVLNASSDADANGKLALDGAFMPVCQGDDVLMSAGMSDPLTRIDVIASAAVGAEKTLLIVTAGVQS